MIPDQTTTRHLLVAIGRYRAELWRNGVSAPAGLVAFEQWLGERDAPVTYVEELPFARKRRLSRESSQRHRDRQREKRGLAV